MNVPAVSTRSGRRVALLNPSPAQIVIGDIAHGLAHQCRFNGQTNQFYSVAQHSLMVAELVPPAYRRAALLHDAAEAYLGDMVKPLKVLLPAFADIEDKVTQLIAQHFDLDFSDYAPIKHADLQALATEKRDLMPHSVEPWSYLKGFDPLPEVIKPLNPNDAKRLFLESWQRLNTPTL